MNVADLIEMLSRYPGDALIVFEDCTDEDDDGSYETFECQLRDDELILRML